jgi:hypothetical protein
MRGRSTPADRRLENWERKYDAERVKQLIEQGKPKMREHAAEAFVSLQQHEVAVKQVLNEYPVPVNKVTDYLCFGREMWKAAGKYAGSLLKRETGIKIAKWVARDLDEVILKAIAYKVYQVEMS